MAKQDYHSTLWIVNKDMVAQSDKRNCINGRKVLIEKGEIIEFRFHSYMNFRTIDDKFYCVTEEIWLEHCLKIGEIHSDVSWKNKAKTEEIWRLELFDWVENGNEIYKKIKEELNDPFQLDKDLKVKKESNKKDR